MQSQETTSVTEGLLAPWLRKGRRLLLLCGLPGCGKTTLASQLACEVPMLLVVEVDEIWDGLPWHETWQEKQSECYRIARGRTREALERGRPVVVDATLLTADYRAQFARIARDMGAPITCAQWPADARVSAARRPYIGAQLIQQWAEIFEEPHVAEGFDVVVCGGSAGQRDG